MYYSHETRDAAMRFFASDVAKRAYYDKIMEDISSTMRKQYYDALLGDFSSLPKRFLYRKSAESLPLTEAIHPIHDEAFVTDHASNGASRRDIVSGVASPVDFGAFVDQTQLRDCLMCEPFGAVTEPRFRRHKTRRPKRL